MAGGAWSGWNVTSSNTDFVITTSFSNGYGRIPVELEGGKVYVLTFKVDITNLVIQSNDSGANISVFLTTDGALLRPTGFSVAGKAVNGAAWTIQNQANVQGYTEDVSLVYYPETTGTYYVHIGVYGNTENILSFTNFVLEEVDPTSSSIKTSVTGYGYFWGNSGTIGFTADGYTLTAAAGGSAQKAGAMAVYLKAGTYTFSADIKVSTDMNCGDSRWGVIFSTVDSIDNLGNPQFLKPTGRDAFETVETTVTIAEDGIYYVFVAKWGGLGSISAKNITFTKIS
jgi:hypothetical protein